MESLKKAQPLILQNPKDSFERSLKVKQDEPAKSDRVGGGQVDSPFGSELVSKRVEAVSLSALRRSKK